MINAWSADVQYTPPTPHSTFLRFLLYTYWFIGGGHGITDTPPGPMRTIIGLEVLGPTTHPTQGRPAKPSPLGIHPAMPNVNPPTMFIMHHAHDACMHAVGGVSVITCPPPINQVFRGLLFAFSGLGSGWRSGKVVESDQILCSSLTKWQKKNCQNRIKMNKSWSLITIQS
jgi:hypothetical protein